MAIDTETERMMNNWAAWKSGASVSVAMSSAYDLEGRGRRAEASIPLINGEAVDVDGAVDALPGDLRAVVIQYWTKTGPIAEKARRCGCHRDTFNHRLEDAHHRIRVHLTALRDAGRRKREALARPITGG